MPAIEVVSDASVALKWFHEEGEQEVWPARALLAAHQERALALVVLDLTAYQIGDALLRGRAKVPPRQVAVVLDALAGICPAVHPNRADLALAVELAERHRLTLDQAAYPAVAQARGATLVTLDQALTRAHLGVRPGTFVAKLGLEPAGY